MTISSLSNFTVLIKKIARKGSLRRKITTKKQRSRSYHHTTTTTTTTTTITSHDHDLASVSTCSSLEDEKHQKIAQDMTTKTNSLVLTTTISLVENDDNDNSAPTTETTTMNDILPTSLSTSNDHEKGTHSDNETTVRDFAYPESSPLHYGQQPVCLSNASQISLSSSRFNGCQAKALYDFTPETDHEIGMKSGQIIWIQYRQCAGWLIADVDDDTGMVPESYVEFL